MHNTLLLLLSWINLILLLKLFGIKSTRPLLLFGIKLLYYDYMIQNYSTYYWYLTSFLINLPDLVLSSVLGGVDTDTGGLRVGLGGKVVGPVLTGFGIWESLDGLLVGKIGVYEISGLDGLAWKGTLVRRICTQFLEINLPSSVSHMILMCSFPPCLWTRSFGPCWCNWLWHWLEWQVNHVPSYQTFAPLLPL